MSEGAGKCRELSETALISSRYLAGGGGRTGETLGGARAGGNHELIAKATLGALALASLAVAAVTPASAQRMTVQIGPSAVVPVVPRACLRAPEFRPAFCFRHDWRDRDRFAFNRDRDWRDRDHMWRERMRREDRQAYLDRRYWEMTH